MSDSRDKVAGLRVFAFILRIDVIYFPGDIETMVMR